MKSKRKKKSLRKRFKLKLLHKQISIKAGLPPGSLVHIGQVFLEKTSMDLVSFNSDIYSLHEQVNKDELDSLPKSTFNWLNIKGLHEVEAIGELGRHLNLNQLTVEDVLNTTQRPKLEDDGNHLFFTMRSFTLADNDVVQEQVSFILGNDLLISFQESDMPIFGDVINRLATANGRIRQKGLDYLLYCLIDVVVDQYFKVLEDIGEQLEEMEDQVYGSPQQDIVERVQTIRKHIITIRKSLIPMQEAINGIIKTAPGSIDKTVLPFFSDIADHVNQCIDFIDVYRELSTEIKESYLSHLSYRMNQVIKLLTIITTIFIPMTFIAGIYGMNFKYMPELQWKYGYFIALCIMIMILVGMLVYFRRKRWL